MSSKTVEEIVKEFDISPDLPEDIEIHYGRRKNLEKVYRAIIESGGHLDNAAQIAGMSITTVWTYRKEYPDLLDPLVDKMKGLMSERILSAFYDNCLNGNVAAQIFYLKTQLGWKETNRLEVEGQMNQEDKKDIEEFRGLLEAWKSADRSEISDGSVIVEGEIV